MSDETQIDHTEMTDDEVLNYTQSIRKNFVNSQLQEGQFPNDTKEQVVLLSALADMDRTAINKKRIGVNEKQAGADALAAEALARLSRDFGSNNPFMRGSDDIPGEVVTPVPDTNHLPPAKAVPGEKDVGINDDTYDNFMGRMDITMGNNTSSENTE